MEPRPYQTTSIERLRLGFVDGHYHQVLSAATGAGKSIIMLMMISLVQAKGKRILFICERKILVEQFSAHLEKAGIDHGVLMSKHWRFRPDQRVQVASAQTLEKYESIPAFDIVFIDEVHACIRKSIVSLMKTRPTMRVIGATATPFTPKLSGYFTNVVNVVTMRELVDKKYLVPFRVFAAKEINTEGLKTDSYGEFERAGMESRASQITGDVVADYLRLSMEIYGELRKGIVFSCGIAHGTELAEKFNDAGINAIQLIGGGDDEYRDEVLKDFKRPDSDIKIVISSEMLERGFDQGDIDFVILAKAIKKSFSKFVQMIGRGARPHPDKKFCVIQDHGNNWLRFSEQWEEFYHNGVKELSAEPDRSTKKEPTREQKEAGKCPKCGALWPAKSDTCAHCGAVRVKCNDVQSVAGEMVEITGQEKNKIEYSTE